MARFLLLRGVLRRRVGVVVLALLATQLGSLVAPAYACGCGALIAESAERVSVSREVSVVRWDGRREQIVMRLTVDGDADRAAWVMPVPNRATVTLGDARLFDQLDATTAPVHRTRYHFWPQDGDWPLVSGDGGPDGVGAPPPGGADRGVNVIGRQALGPFDVAQLTATDPNALGVWLRNNGFSLPSRLSTALKPYVTAGWEYVAIRLAPDTAGTALQGVLDPLRLSFTADEPVYPMRLSRLASTPQSLGLYVLAAHRMEPTSRIGGSRPRVTYAGRVAPRSGPLSDLIDGTPFLTAIAQEFPTPSQITTDHVLRRAPEDTPFHQVIYEDRLRELAGVPAWMLTVIAASGTLTAATTLLAIRRPRPPRGPAIPPRPTYPPTTT